MKNKFFIFYFSFFILFTVADRLSAYSLVLKDGRVMTTYSRPSVAGNNVVWMDEDGKQWTAPVEDVDLEETMKINNRLDGLSRKKYKEEDLPKEGKIWVIGEGTGKNVKSFFWQLKRLYKEPLKSDETRGRVYLILFQMAAWLLSTFLTVRAIKWLGGGEEAGWKVFFINLLAAVIIIIFGGLAFGTPLLEGGNIDLIALFLSLIPVFFLYKWAFTLSPLRILFLLVIQIAFTAVVTALGIFIATLVGIDLSDLRF